MAPRIHAFLLLPAAVLLACGGEGTTPPTTPPSSTAHMSSTAVAYLDSALHIMQFGSYYRDKLDWTTIRATAFAIADAAAAQKPADTYPAIRASLTSLGDHHSFLQPASPTSNRIASGMLAINDRAPATATLSAHPADSLDGEIVGGRYGYLRIPAYGPLNGTTAMATAFADTLQGLVRVVDASSPCGWIVDTRHNGGGNMWPMLAGVGPIIGEGTNLGGFVNAYGLKYLWFYTAGGAGSAGDGAASVAASVSRAAYKLRAPNPPVAVLTDGRTASSGEAIVVAFRGRPNARSFGVATFGLPTANAGYGLPDGAIIFLMVALDLDRNGNQYIDPIIPDEVVPTIAAPATDDAAVAAATSWLAKQAPCSSASAQRGRR